MEKSIKGTQTEKKPLKSFAWESQAASRYRLFAAKVREDGYEQIATFLKKQPIRKIGQWTLPYLEFARIAEEEGFKRVAYTFKLVAGVELEHEKRNGINFRIF